VLSILILIFSAPKTDEGGEFAGTDREAGMDIVGEWGEGRTRIGRR